MSFNSWLQSMIEASQSARSRQQVVWRSVDDHIERVRQRVSEIALRTELDQATGWQSNAALKAQVEAHLRAGSFQALTRRELRIAVGLFNSVSVDRIAALVRTRPEAHALLVDAFFGSWDALRDHTERAELANLVSSVPASSGCRLLHRRFSPAELCNKSSPQLVGTLASKMSLQQVDVFLFGELACRRTWEYTYEVLATWVKLAFEREPAGELFATLEAHPTLMHALLPPTTRGGFWDSWPVRAGGTAPLRAQAILLVAAIRACLDSRNALTELFMECVLRSTIGDPRVPPLSKGWLAVKENDSQLFHRLVAELVKEDLSLFFKLAMNEEDREAFWLTYLGSIRRTLCVFSQATYEDVSKRLSRTKQGSAALTRAIRGRGPGASAFCLFFDKLVVVEFSDTGNAAYIYARREFESKLLPSLKAANAPRPTDLKDKDLSHERILHGVSWMGRARELLEQLGVVPAGRAKA